MKLRKKILNVVLTIGFVLSFQFSYSQSVIDSLENELSKTVNKSDELNLLIDIAEEYFNSDVNKSLLNSKKAYELALELKDTTNMLESLYQIASAHLDLGNYDASLKGYQDQEKLSKIYKSKMYEAKSYYGIGIVNYYIGYFDKALEYWEKEMEVEIEMNDSSGIALTMNNISAVYFEAGDTLSSLEYDYKILKMYRELNDLDGVATALNNISATNIALNNNEEALENAEEALFLNKKFRKYKSISISFQSLAQVYKAKNNLQKSNLYADSALMYADSIENINERAVVYRSVGIIYFENSNFKDAFTCNSAYLVLHDSINKIENRSLVTEMNTKYETEKKEKANELLRKQGELDNLEINAQKRQRIILFSGLGLTFILLIIIFNRFKKSQRQKKLIEKQKEEVELQKELIEEKSTEITDSINYAQRIQQALLKSEEHVSSQFPPHFILLKPKDIVSGDFYWAIEKQGSLYISVADCTGHGVPGAFMSMLGIAFLNEINSGEELLTPAEILDELRNRIIRELSQTGSIEGSKDGMDMCIIKIDKDHKEMEWAGANNPLFIVNGKEVKEIKADRQPVAFSDFAKPFTNHIIKIEEECCLYLFSDGYVDQFGGPKGKKYKAKQYKQLLLDIYNEDMDMQKVKLNNSFENWKGDLEQIDDVCVVGLRL